MKRIDKEIFGKRLKLLLDEKGISQKELAEYLGSTEKAVCDWVKGRKEPRYYYLEELAKHLQVNIHYLTGRTSSRTDWAIFDEEHQDMLASIKANPFEDYLKSIGFTVDYEVEVEKWHWEDALDEDGKVIGRGKVSDKETLTYVLEKGDRRIKVTAEAFDGFQQSVENYIQFEFFKLIERKE